jgi:hypothetical protein
MPVASWAMARADANANSGKQRVACEFSWLLRVIDHEAVLLDPNLFSGLVPRPVVLLERRSGRQTGLRRQTSDKLLRQAAGVALLSSREKLIG